MRIVGSNPTIDQLVELARRGAEAHAPSSEAAGYEALEDKLLLRRRSRSRRRALAFAFAIVLPLAGFGARRAWLAPTALSYKVVNGTALDGSRVVGGADTNIEFSDGSEVSLDPGTETRISDVKEQGGRVDIDDGTVHVAITSRPKAAWFVHAGPYEIRVTGTRFDARWSAHDHVFELVMHHGSVVVTGPLIAGSIPAHAGQRLLGGLPEGRFVIEDLASPIGTTAAPAASLPGAESYADRQNLEPAADTLGSSSPQRADDSRSPRSWRRLLAGGSFRTVIEQAEQRGLERTLATSSLEDLSALSDAARYARNTDLSRRTLLSERQRFASSATAHEAAFLLGRVEEDAGGAAMEWYARYLSESPNGPYASQALGRQMMLVYRQSGRAAATPIANDYLSRYPRGPYASAASKILDTATTAPPK